MVHNDTFLPVSAWLLRTNNAHVVRAVLFTESIPITLTCSHVTMIIIIMLGFLQVYGYLLNYVEPLTYQVVQ